jgi:hypothetical protein
MAPTSLLFCLALVAQSTVTSVYGTQVMSQPAGYKNPPNQVKTNLTPEVHHIEKRATGKVSMAVRTNVLVHHVIAQIAESTSRTGASIRPTISASLLLNSCSIYANYPLEPTDIIPSELTRTSCSLRMMSFLS